jgi:hypothetical protein
VTAGKRDELHGNSNQLNSPAQYELSVSRIREAQSFYEAHRPEIDASLRVEQELKKRD